ncbi:MAG: CRISPR-associated helicase Cas3' [Lachnospiraceae bacterium]|nr:CRISPR-associated helicase Cas3' [Lachnospiraceae bacterium]
MKTTEYLAHINEDGNCQTVLEHLQGTAELCAIFASRFGAEEQGMFIGLLHDIGKCSIEFQNRLRGGQIVDHSTAGAYESAKKDALWAAGCIAGHHSGLPDYGNMRNNTEDDATLFGRLKKAHLGKIPHYDCPVQIDSIQAPPGFGNSYLTDSFVIRMLYSCLVDADYLDTEQFMNRNSLRPSLSQDLEILLDKLNRYIQPWWNPTKEINKWRCQILRDCIEGGKKEKGLFTLTVPTGGGKTVASMAFALNHAIKHGMNRVIYVIPYTSIIEQTADVFRAIFGDINVLEHHANVSFEVKEGGNSIQYHLSQATENWDCSVIVTTAVQFFDSLYANRSSKCRKLHNIANSVLIFDEAQMIPTAHLKPCVAAIAKLVEDFGCSAVLCTATQPVLNDLLKKYASEKSVYELCTDLDGMFSRFRRVCFTNIGEITAENLSAQLSEKKQVLCIVNSRKAAQEIYCQLPKDGAFHLSTLMFPAHRRSVLAEIRSRLKDGRICRVVSTSLIEAGVDVDFPFVYREMAGLDSILQAAGRCNREGKRKADESIVTIFEGVSKVPQMLQVNIGAAKEALADGADPLDLLTVQRYFKSYRSFAGDALDKYKIIDAFEKGISGCLLPFKSVAERFHLIDDASKTIYIPIGEGKTFIERLKCGEKSRELFRKLGQYSVSVYDQQFQVLSEMGKLEILSDDSAILFDPDNYNLEMGLIVGNSNKILII